MAENQSDRGIAPGFQVGHRRNRLRGDRHDPDRRLQVTAGLTAIFNDAFYVTTRNYRPTTAWGWLHLIIGLFLVVTALALRPPWRAS